MLYNPRTVAAIAAASLLAAFAAQANKGAEYKPHHHKEHHKNFFITGGATYLEPSFNGLDYAVASESDGTNNYAQGELVEPEFGWGYFIQAGYRISHHYDVEASWAQYNSNLSDSFSIDGSSTSTIGLTTSNRFGFTPIPAGATAFAESKQNINYSVFDANLGQYHDITEMLRARIFAGIRYAKIDADVDNLYFTNPTSLTVMDDYDSSFNGVGPEIGLDLEYKVWHTIGVVGHLAGSFLIGQQDASSNVYNDDFSAQVEVKGDSTARMIPGLDAKLGANWNVPYAYEKVSFGIEAGYQVAYYWDVIDQIQFTSNTDLSQHNYENYGNMGPYLNFTAMF
jgi:hypothetical protein